MGNSDSENMLALTREFYGRICYTHKTHEKERELLHDRVRGTKWITVLFSGLTTIFAFLGTATSEKWAAIASGIFAALSTAFVVYQLNFNHEKDEAEHRHAAKKLLALRERYLLLIEKILASASDSAELRKELEQLQNEVCLIYEHAPDTSSKAYQMAHQGLKKNEELTFTDSEIDQLLPEKLRAKKQSGLQA